MGVGGQRHALGALLPGKNWYPLHRWMGGPQGQSGQVQKILPPPRFDSWTVQPVASRYTDYAILAYNFGCSTSDKFESVEQPFFFLLLLLLLENRYAEMDPNAKEKSHNLGW